MMQLRFYTHIENILQGRDTILDQIFIFYFFFMYKIVYLRIFDDLPKFDRQIIRELQR